MPVLKVLLDENGEIVGTAHVAAAGSGARGPDHVVLVARPGQRVVEITIDDKTAALDAENLHQEIKALHVR